jgi:hypothetical protein
VPRLRRNGANILIGRELSDGRQRSRISGEWRRSLGGRVRLKLLRVVLVAIKVASWASGGAAANEKAKLEPSTRAPDVADNLPWNWRDGSCRIIAENVTMAATDDMVPQVEVGIQGTRPRGVPTAWERTWAGMTRRAEPVAVDWLWRGRHLDLETGSLVRGPNL